MALEPSRPYDGAMLQSLKSWPVRAWQGYGRGRNIWLDFGPFLLVLATYDSFTAIIPSLNARVHFNALIAADRWIGGGQLPALWLQRYLYAPGLHWYDFAMFALYLSHFLLPVVLAWFIWRYRTEWFRRYIFSFVAITYAAFVVFLVYPAAPPWLAAEHGLLPAGFVSVFNHVWNAIVLPWMQPLYRQNEPNPVAAFPSLHAAYPALFWLYVRRLWGWRWAWPLLIYPLAVWLAVVYLGEHYVVDVIGGVTLAAICSWPALWPSHPDQAGHS